MRKKSAWAFLIFAIIFIGGLAWFVAMEGISEEASNSHRYNYYLEDSSWTEAFQKAKEKGGYLVNINDEEEMNSIIEDLQNLNYMDKHFYIGAKRMPDSSEYYWTSENLSLYGGALNGRTEWINAWWDDAEPSYKNVEFEETCVEMFYSENKGQWVLNDVVDGFLMDQEYLSGKVGYIVEYEN